MRSPNEQQDFQDGSSYQELKLLSEVDWNPNVTQRQLSQRAGMALGLTNLVMRNLVQKGYIRVSRASWKRRIYTLKPEGFFNRIRLMRTYIRRVLTDYQRIRETLREELAPLSLNAESRVAIYGTGEFAELIYLGIRGIGIEEIDIFASGRLDEDRFLGLQIQDLTTLDPVQYDQVVVALLTDWEQARDELRSRGALPEKLVTFFADGRAREEG